MYLATEIPPAPRPTPRIIRLFWGYVHNVLIKFSFKYQRWTGRELDNQILPLPFGLLIKRSDGTRIEEVLAMQVARAAGLPVPRVICYGEHPDMPHAPISILMTTMPGCELNTVYRTMTPEQQATILSELKQYLDVMRRWPNPWGANRICSVSGTAVRSVRVPSHSMGPFESELELNKFLLSHTWSGDFKSPEEYEEALAKAKEMKSIPHKIVFTHGDLVHHNILVHDGHVSAILDWEAAGWLPEYWEFTTAWRFMNPRHWWYDVVKALGGGDYLKEFECEKALMLLTSCSYACLDKSPAAFQFNIFPQSHLGAHLTHICAFIISKYNPISKLYSNMSLKDLKHNALYVTLFLRKPEYAPDDFHWGLYLHDSELKGGMKYHVRGMGEGWMADHANTLGVFKSNFLVGLFQLANIPDSLGDRAKDLITQEDSMLNSIPGNTCLVWLMRALSRLQSEGILKCSDLSALEREIKDWGNSQQLSAIDAEKPRPLGKSSLCGPL